MTFLETILGEILQVFKNEGIETNSEQNLIKRLDIRQSTFHELFSDKGDMVKKTVAFDLEEQKRAHAAILAEASSAVEKIIILLQDGIKNIRQTNPAYVIDLRTHYPEAWQMCLDHLNSFSYHEISGILNEGILSGDFRKDINIQLVTKIILEQLNMMLNPTVFPPDYFNLAEVFRSIYLYYVRGLCTERGGKLAEEIFSRLTS
ncbi:TetR/AcrR family transcriptional regulator [Pontibacter sp. SGAir0037]|uniref:TetR/AcrR family transcriptional regulator n=1 Tax=Pontibacter sp. SGAir0037 TaxID=2571030 RepID=UPI0010CD1909|nr:TetR/AcrR family transcriptional regulator [Pontibacter sp. SGAir0037]QCR23950.1 hypothetical protein C1N53_17395 [Pontibacter sp. SGAir0037]